MDKYRRIADTIKALPADERAAAMRSIRYIQRRKSITQAKAVDCVVDIIGARARAEARRKSDRKTDAKRRVLVGARVDRELAERCRAAAEAQGVSLYRWVTDALNAHL